LSAVHSGSKADITAVRGVLSRVWAAWVGASMTPTHKKTQSIARDANFMHVDLYRIDRTHVPAWASATQFLWNAARLFYGGVELHAPRSS